MCFIFLSNSYLTNKIIFEPVNPDVKSALLYVKKNIRNGDLITYSCGWFTLVIEKNASGIFNSEEIRKSTCNILLEDFPGKDELERPYKLMTLEKILRQKETIKRIWVLFPWEDILGVDHLNIKSLNSDISLLKRNLGFVNVWNGNKISVYLFNVD